MHADVCHLQASKNKASFNSTHLQDMIEALSSYLCLAFYVFSMMGKAAINLIKNNSIKPKFPHLPLINVPSFFMFKVHPKIKSAYFSSVLVCHLSI